MTTNVKLLRNSRSRVEVELHGTLVIKRVPQLYGRTGKQCELAIAESVLDQSQALGATDILFIVGEQEFRQSLAVVRAKGYSYQWGDGTARWYCHRRWFNREVMEQGRLFR